MTNEQFIKHRITQLRLKKNVSEYEMSLYLGRNQNYIREITSGKSLPSMCAFFDICDYFEISPYAFFEMENPNPVVIDRITELLKKQSDETLQAILLILQNLQKPAKN